MPSVEELYENFDRLDRGEITREELERKYGVFVCYNGHQHDSPFAAETCLPGDEMPSRTPRSTAAEIEDTLRRLR